MRVLWVSPQSLLPEVGIGTEKAEASSESIFVLCPQCTQMMWQWQLVWLLLEAQPRIWVHRASGRARQPQVGHGPVGFASPPVPRAMIGAGRRWFTEG